VARTPKGRALGSALRKAREDCGWKMREFAFKLGRDPGVLSRWETGERTPKPEQVAQILTTLGINGERYEEIVALAYGTDETLWVATSLPEQRQQLAAFIDYEQKARTITEVSPLLVPGLLQTDDYIRAIMSGGGVSPGEVVTRFAIRVSRRAVLTRKEPVQFFALVGEGALYQAIGGREVMVEQLGHLLDMCQRPNIDLRVVPYGGGWSPALEGAFTLIEPESAIPAVQIENRRSGLFLHDEDDVNVYRQAVEMTLQVALSPSESTGLINRAMNRWETSA
jgi:transcriptional regulator with XRE-family HTH domain